MLVFWSTFLCLDCLSLLLQLTTFYLPWHKYPYMEKVVFYVWLGTYAVHAECLHIQQNPA